MTDREKDVEKYLKKKKDNDTLVSNLKALFFIITVIIGLICGVLVFIYKIKNPHLTETELMIYTFSKYWWLVLMVIISALMKND